MGYSDFNISKKEKKKKMPSKFFFFFISFIIIAIWIQNSKSLDEVNLGLLILTFHHPVAITFSSCYLLEIQV